MSKLTHNIEFTKMHGAGNDYIYVNTMQYPIENPDELSIRWSAPHTGIGADGLVLIGKSDKADFSMRIFNADGSEAMMCGNATRCIGKYVYEKGLTDKKNITLDTLSGIKEIQLTVKDQTVSEVTVDMGKPEIEQIELTLEIDNKKFTGSSISMGNPHFVIFVDEVEKVDLSVIGPLLETHPVFPNRTNVEFVEVIDEKTLRMRVWERGSGVTQACGTGACATAVTGVIKGKSKRKSRVIMDGGPLAIEWDEKTDRVYMTGEAVRVFEGTIHI